MQITVLLVLPSLERCAGGPSRLVPLLCDGLVQESVRVVLVSSGSSCDNILPTNERVKVIFLSERKISNINNIVPQYLTRSLIKIANSEHVNIVHSQGIWSAMNHAAAKAANNLKLPLMISPQGMLSPWALKQKAFKKKFAMRIFERDNLESASVINATAILEEFEVRSLGLRNPIAIIPNPVDIPNWREPNNGVEPRTVLFLSRIHPKKGLLELVHAWATVQPKGWRCIVAGPDEENHRAAVEAAVRDEELEDAFTFYGPVEGAAKWELYRKADLFVLPTHSENFGLVVAEALACGIPAITTKAAPWELLEQERCGWWTEPTIDGLEAALHTATQLPQAELRAMGLRGRKAVEKRFAWPRVAAEMKQVYQWLCSGGAAPDCVHFYKH